MQQHVSALNHFKAPADSERHQDVCHWTGMTLLVCDSQAPLVHDATGAPTLRNGKSR